MTDPLGEGRKFPRWRDAAREIYKETGWKGMFMKFHLFRWEERMLSPFD
jgi:solute carrier family 25 carnitine/acylcarnitine transporter 20/29